MHIQDLLNLGNFLVFLRGAWVTFLPHFHYEKHSNLVEFYADLRWLNRENEWSGNWGVDLTHFGFRRPWYKNERGAKSGCEDLEQNART